jgi:SAM-dependent methyltransferase
VSIENPSSNFSGPPRSPDPAASRLSAAAWLQTPLGQYLLERERGYIDKTVADIFGYNALQIGLPQLDLLRANRMPMRVSVDRGADAGLRADAAELPLAGASVDLVLLPHVLDFSEHPHQILREVERVLVPDGHLVITCFNPMSLWGLRRWASEREAYPWNGRFIHLMRLKDWLALLGFEMAGGGMGCYAPPCATQRWLDRFAFMESAGDRWWPFSGAVMFLHAIKRVRGMHVITPQWAQQARNKRLVAMPQKQQDQLAARGAQAARGPRKPPLRLV